VPMRKPPQIFASYDEVRTSNKNVLCLTQLTIVSSIKTNNNNIHMKILLIFEVKVKVKVKADLGAPSQSYGPSLAIWDHTVLPATDTSERAPANPSHAGWYSIYLPWRDGRLS